MTDKDLDNRRESAGETPSSSVEKAAERMSREPDQNDGPEIGNSSLDPMQATDRQTSSIERILDAADGPSEEFLNDGVVDNDTTAHNAPPAQQTDAVPESIAALREEVAQTRSNVAAGTQSAPPPVTRSEAPDQAKPTAGYRGQDPGNQLQTQNQTAVPDPRRKGLLRRKRGASKPWQIGRAHV